MQMTGEEFKEIRENLKLDATAFARALGYNAKAQSLRSKIYCFESERWPIPAATAMLAYMLDAHGIPDGTWFSGGPLTRLISMCFRHGVKKDLLTIARLHEVKT